MLSSISVTNSINTNNNSVIASIISTSNAIKKFKVCEEKALFQAAQRDTKAQEKLLFDFCFTDLKLMNQVEIEKINWLKAIEDDKKKDDKKKKKKTVQKINK